MEPNHCLYLGLCSSPETLATQVKKENASLQYGNLHNRQSILCFSILDARSVYL